MSILSLSIENPNSGLGATQVKLSFVPSLSDNTLYLIRGIYNFARPLTLYDSILTSISVNGVDPIQGDLEKVEGVFESIRQAAFAKRLDASIINNVLILTIRTQ